MTEVAGALLTCIAKYDIASSAHCSGGVGDDAVARLHQLRLVTLQIYLRHSNVILSTDSSPSLATTDNYVIDVS